MAVVKCAGELKDIGSWVLNVVINTMDSSSVYLDVKELVLVRCPCLNLKCVSEVLGFYKDAEKCAVVLATCVFARF